MEITLHDLLPNDWGTNQPARLSELLEADYKTLDKPARGLRALVVEAIHGFERTPCVNADACRQLLEKHHLPRVPGRWAVVALNERRDRMYQRSKGGGMRMMSLVRDNFPTPDSTAKGAPLPEGGVYLAVFGGGIDILSDDAAYERFVAFTDKHPVADVVFWDDDGKTASFWSVAAEAGSAGSTELEFPTTAPVARWRERLCTR
jgi:hypothetical protein